MASLIRDSLHLRHSGTRTALSDTAIWQTLYSFQKDGAKAAINKILTTNGCILADSVGLGKIFTALAVVKYFELKNERVLVLCPKKLRRNWTVYRSNSSLKRLESSVDSFRLTLKRTIEKIDALEVKIEKFEAHAEANGDLDFDSVFPDQFEDPDIDPDLVKGFTIGGRRKLHLAHLKLDEWLKAVRHDRTQLQYLLDKTEKVTPERDAKLAQLRELIFQKVANPPRPTTFWKSISSTTLSARISASATNSSRNSRTKSSISKTSTTRLASPASRSTNSALSSSSSLKAAATSWRKPHSVSMPWFRHRRNTRHPSSQELCSVCAAPPKWT